MGIDFRNSGWRRLPSWILVYVHFWYDSCVLWQILNIPTNFGKDWSISGEIAKDFLNSWWRRQPSWKIHFRLIRQYEEGTRGLLLSLKKLTFVGLSWRLRVVYSRGLECWSDFGCKSTKSENGSKCWCILGRGPPKNKFEGFKLRKGACTKQKTSFELLKRANRSRIATCRWDEETEKLKKRENESHKTVIFCHCVEVLPVIRFQPNLSCL